MKIKHLLTLLLTMATLPALAQGSGIKGKVVSRGDRAAIEQVKITLTPGERQATSDAEGRFRFDDVASGDYTLTFEADDYEPLEIKVRVDKLTKDVRSIALVPVYTEAFDDSIFAEFDTETANDTQSLPSSLSSSKDVFNNIASYKFGEMRFNLRGYDSQYTNVYFNGIRLNDALTGYTPWSLWSGLNDATRNQENTTGLQAADYGLGGIGGTTNINATASQIRKGLRVSLVNGNSMYRFRAMVSYASGLLDNGWSYAFSVSTRQGGNDWVNGIYYNCFGYYGSVEKRFNERNRLTFTILGAPTERGAQQASTQEVYDLVGNNYYNPNWGYQDGKKRNARVRNNHEPLMVVNYTNTPDDRTKIDAAASFRFGTNGYSALTWKGGADPRPDYYRYLPSYFEDEDMQMQYRDLWRSGRPDFTQINWDNLYLANANNLRAGNGAAVYMVEERRSDLLETSFNSTLNKQFNRHLGLTAGVGARFTQSRQFKTVDDLLGSNYVLDIDKFAERDFSGDHDKLQNDLNRPDRKVYKDGIFGYNFNLNIYSANAWAVNRYTSRHWDYYYGAKLTYTNFRRDGKMRNGRYPDSSYGKGIRHQFTDITVKGGLTYKFNGRHMLTANISYGSEAPLPNEAYISPRITDRTIDNMKSGRIFSADLNYVFSMPQLAGRIGVFQTNFYDQMERNSYYDGIEGTFINHVLYGVNRIHRGLELGATYKLDDHWSFDLAGTISEYYYSNNPDGVKHSENGKITDQEKVYMKDVYVGGMPQFAGTFGVRYFVNYWFLGANVNGFARNYIEVAPLRRLSSNYASVNPYNPEQMEAYRTLTTQERFPAAYTVDISVGKIFYLPGRQSVNFNLSVNNLLNKKDICTGGYEQGRSDLSYPTRFGGKYYYMQGLNCFLNVSYRF